MAAPKVILLLLLPLLLLLLLLLLQPALTAAAPTSPAPPPPAPPAPAPPASAPPAPPAPDAPVVIGPPMKKRPANNTKTHSTGGKSTSGFKKWLATTIVVISIPPAIVGFLYSVHEVLRERYPETFTFRLRDQPGEGHLKLYTTIAILASYAIGAAVSIYELIDSLKH